MAEPIHILMRFSDNITGVADTIAAHNGVIQKHGAVWIGKMGKPLGRNYIRRINEQCNQGIVSYLYLVQKGRGGYRVYRGTVLEMCRQIPLKETRLIPNYYTRNRLLNFVGFWVKLSDVNEVSVEVLNNLLISSSGMAVPSSLPRSMAALFVVRDGQGLRG